MSNSSSTRAQVTANILQYLLRHPEVSIKAIEDAISFNRSCYLQLKGKHEKMVLGTIDIHNHLERYLKDRRLGVQPKYHEIDLSAPVTPPVFTPITPVNPPRPPISPPANGYANNKYSTPPQPKDKMVFDPFPSKLTEEQQRRVGWVTQQAKKFMEEYKQIPLGKDAVGWEKDVISPWQEALAFIATMTESVPGENGNTRTYDIRAVINHKSNVLRADCPLLWRPNDDEPGMVIPLDTPTGKRFIWVVRNIPGNAVRFYVHNSVTDRDEAGYGLRMVMDGMNLVEVDQETYENILNDLVMLGLKYRLTK